MDQVSSTAARRARRPLLRWAAERWPALAVALVAGPLAAITTLGTLDWPGRPFPGFFLAENAVIPSVGLYQWTGLAAGVPFHARVLAVDGRPVRTGADVYAYVAALPIGTPVRYTLTKQGETFERTVPTMRFGARDYWLTVGLFVVNGLVFLVCGIVVSLLQPRTRASRAFLLLGFLTGLFPLTGTALYNPRLWWLSHFHFFTQAMFPANLIHFGLVFPVERPAVARHGTWLLVPYAIGAVLTLWMYRTFYAAPPDLTALYATFLYSALGVALLFALQVLAYWENRTPLVRPRVKAVLPGSTLATAVLLFGFINQADAGGNFPINLGVITPVLFYVSIGYAIAKHDLFDIDAVLKQTAVYVALTVAITGVYAGALVVLGWLAPTQAVRASPVFHIVFVALVAFLFAPLRDRVQHVIDRTFFRGQLDYRRTVSELSAALTSLLDLDEILGRVGRTLVEGLKLRSLAVVLWGERETQLLRFDQGAHRLREAEPVPGEALRHLLDARPRKPWRLVEEDVSPDGEEPPVRRARAESAALDAVLVVPLPLGERVIGAFALGAKRSGQGFTREDSDLLETLAAESAIAIQNARSYRDLKTLNEQLEEKVRARTAELQLSHDELDRAYRDLQAAQAQLVHSEKVASLGALVAGVAHELNNPLSFIVTNVEPLRRRLAGIRELAVQHGAADLVARLDQVREIFEVIARGAERTAGIVTDLRTFSRLGETQPKPVDLHEGIEVSLRLLGPRLAEGVTVHREYGTLPAVEVDPGQINQVFMNLLVNACDALGGRGNIWIRTGHDGDRVTVSIRDDGGGIAPEHLPRIFDPFFTTKPVGKGTGLGLSISHGIVTDHGGTIRARSDAGAGTEFTIVLPVRPVAKAS